MTHIDSGDGLTYGHTAERVGGTPLLRGLALFALFIAAIMMRQVVAGNSDVSWLLIAGERWLDGQRLYSDILETNPPMAVLVYVPGILMSRVLGISVEIAVDGLLFLAIALSLGSAALILRNSFVLAANQRWPFAMVAVAVLAILPAQVFGQREHIAFHRTAARDCGSRAADQPRDSGALGYRDCRRRTRSGDVLQAPFRPSGGVLSWYRRAAPEIVASARCGGEPRRRCHCHRL
jgi:hypothetical protein